MALPSPNNIHSLAPACHMPNIVSKFDGASALVVNFWQQLLNLIKKNTDSFLSCAPKAAEKGGIRNKAVFSI